MEHPSSTLKHFCKLVILNYSEKLTFAVGLFQSSDALETLKSCTEKKVVTLSSFAFGALYLCNKESKRNVRYSNESILPKYDMQRSLDNGSIHEVGIGAFGQCFQASSGQTTRLAFL